MKHLITTLLLLIAAVVVTLVYFRSLNQPGKRPVEVMRHIPDDASLVIEFSNDDGFYDAFSGNRLLSSIIGPDETNELEILRKALLQDAAFKSFFDNQHIFISIHPTVGNQLDLLITTSVNGKFKGTIADKLATLHSNNFTAVKISNSGKDVFKITIPQLKRPFFLTESAESIISGSFSSRLITTTMAYNLKQHKDSFIHLSDQQNDNALAVLYINHQQLQPLFEQLFTAKNPELLRPLRMLSANAALSLNYKTNALMFNGLTEIEANKPLSYLNLFASQQPVINHLKDIFPSTTAYSINFAVSSSGKFVKALAGWNNKSGSQAQEQALFKNIKKETGVNFDKDFNSSLGKEFAIVTTRFGEKLAIIELAENQQLSPSLTNISTMQSENIGQFNYSKIPFYLLGDSFGIFNKPYFIVINNYLIMANTPGELRSYYESYNNQKFMSKTAAFNEFNDLLSERSNVAFFVNFKNIKPILKGDLKPSFYSAFDKNDPGFENYYAASYQLVAADRNFYTNFCMELNKADSTKNKNQ